jgi:hypothetical protein
LKIDDSISSTARWIIEAYFNDRAKAKKSGLTPRPLDEYRRRRDLATICNERRERRPRWPARAGDFWPPVPPLRIGEPQALSTWVRLQDTFLFLQVLDEQKPQGKGSIMRRV